MSTGRPRVVPAPGATQCHPRRMTLTGGRVRPRRGPRPLALSVAVVTVAALAGCGGGDGDGPAGQPGQQVADGTTFDAVSPLTGQQLEGDAAARPVLAVKIDNSGSSAPQIRMGSADLVTEELVEGGITRLAVFYQSRMPTQVGPVRSM